MFFLVGSQDRSILMPASTSFSFKASKDSSLDRFAAWMKTKYSEPREPGQRGAARIKDGKNPKTFIPDQISSIISSGQISPQFTAEIKAFNEDEKYRQVSDEMIHASMKKKNPQKFAEFEAFINEAKEDALKKLLAGEV